MILAGLVLFAVGAVDLCRRFLPSPVIGYLVVAGVLVVGGALIDALPFVVAAAVLAAAWWWSMPLERRAPVGFWPAVALAAVCASAVLILGERPTPGLIDALWRVQSPIGAVSVDLVVLALGATLFLLESANLVVRAALDGENAWRPREPGRATAPVAERSPGAPETADEDGFQGGRLIGPLERVLVLALTLAGAYPLLAAMLAAKGIVRFPEISRDGAAGARAEYFLVGSLVSWVTALGAALLVWWAAASGAG